jgi:hypothetical protein
MKANLNELIMYYLEDDINLYDPDVVDFMAQLLIESNGIPGIILKDDLQYEGMCYFNKSKGIVEIEQDDDTIITLEMPFEFLEIE